MTKHKHNKKKNVAFLYEVLVLGLTKAIVSKNEKKRHALTEVFKTFFGKGMVLNKELGFYKELYQNVCDSPETAKDILQMTKQQYNKLDQNSLNKAKEQLNFKIKKNIGKQAMSTFVPNYKTIASISQIFNEDTPPKTKVLLEQEIIKDMHASTTEKDKMEHIDELAMKTFIKKFNETYGVLHEEQITLLNKYIMSFADDGIDLALFLNEEIKRLKGEMANVLEHEDVKKDSVMLEKANKVRNILNEFEKKEPDKKMVEQVLKVQNLIREIENDD